eukprot:m51a1_g9324 hypothetical protein (334) ;mRNA; r:216-1699
MSVLVFVYGSLKRGHWNAHFLEGQQFVGEARTVPGYRLYDVGSYPAMVAVPPGSRPTSVQGELWRVSPEAMARLDALEEVPDLYVRASVQLEGPHAAVGPVVAYLYNRSVDGLADLGDFVKHLGRCATTTHHIIIGFCAVVLVLAVALLSVGISTRVSEDAVRKLRVPGIETLPAWMISLGVLLALISVFGIVGAYLYNKKLLIVFAVLMGIVVVAQLTVGITAAVQYKKLPEVLDLAWTLSSNKTVANLQDEFKCCGFYNTTDRAVLPCEHKEVCEGKLYNAVSSVATSAGATGIALSCIELAGVALTVYLLVRIGYVSVQHMPLYSDDLTL